jgi:hypothetical protein
MKSWKTTIVGAGLAIMTAIKPLLNGSGYHLDKKTIGTIIFAGLLAAFGYLSKDFDTSGKP